MDDEFFGLVVLVLVSAPFATAILHILANASLKSSCHQRECDLKLKLVEAGMGPGEIEQVIRAGRTPGRPEQKPLAAAKGPFGSSLPTHRQVFGS